MSLPLKPLPRLLEDMRDHGQTWPEVHEDLEFPEVVVPDRKYPHRMRLYGKRFMGVAVQQGNELLLIGVRLRYEKPTEPSPVQVVGREEKAPRRRAKGKSGGQWPTSVKELIHRIEAKGGYEIVRSARGNFQVLHEGRRIATLPVNPREHRALINCCLQLKGAGLDVRKAG